MNGDKFSYDAKAKKNVHLNINVSILLVLQGGSLVFSDMFCANLITIAPVYFTFFLCVSRHRKGSMVSAV